MIILLFFVFASAVVPYHNYHTTFVPGTLVIVDLVDRVVPDCENAFSVQVPKPTCDANAGDIIAELQELSSGNSSLGAVPYGKLIMYRQFGFTNNTFNFDSGTMLDINSIFGGSAIGEVEAYVKYGGTTTCTLPTPGTGLGGIDLTEGGTRNAFSIETEGDVGSLIDITVYNTTGGHHRMKGLYLNRLTRNYYFNFGQSEIYTDVDVIEIRLRPDERNYYTNTDIQVVDIRTGSTSGCLYKESFVHKEWEKTPQCIGNGYPLCSPYTGPTNFIEGGVEYNTLNFNPLPYGNTFHINETEYTGNSGLPTPWKIEEIGFIGVIRNRFIVAIPIVPSSLRKLVFDFRSVSTSPSALFRTVQFTYTVGNSDFCESGLPVTGPEMTVLGVDLVTPLGAPIVVVESGFPAVFMYSFNASSNVIRGVRFDWSNFDCTKTAFSMGVPFHFVDSESITYELGADGDCLVQPESIEKVLPPCVDISGRIFLDSNGDGIMNNGETVAKDIVVELDSDVGPTSTSASGHYAAACQDVGSVVQITVCPPPGFVSSTGPITVNYTVTSDCEQTIPLIGITQVDGLCGRIYNDLNGNGTQSLNEPGIANVTVKATFHGDNETMVFAVTDQFGNFLIDPILTGNHTIDIVGYPMADYVQTEGMDPHQVTVLFMPNNTKVGPFGYTYVPPPTPAPTPAPTPIFMAPTTKAPSEAPTEIPTEAPTSNNTLWIVLGVVGGILIIVSTCCCCIRFGQTNKRIPRKRLKKRVYYKY